MQEKKAGFAAMDAATIYVALEDGSEACEKIRDAGFGVEFHYGEPDEQHGSIYLGSIEGDDPIEPEELAGVLTAIEDLCVGATVFVTDNRHGACRTCMEDLGSFTNLEYETRY